MPGAFRTAIRMAIRAAMGAAVLMAAPVAAEAQGAPDPTTSATPPAAPTPAASPPPTAAASWEATLERAVPAVVVIRGSAPRPFDTESPGTYTATGFVVDAERGLILTNRHVVGAGPVVAEAIFQNHEEVDVRAVYRDPVHDFGFFRYDPDAVQFMEPGALELAPERARVGIEIRVIGNDAGEKLSILGGTLARLDREAPDYGTGRYNDFNTFYYQAASNTSGGSSGSPVIDRSGRVVALNAGGRSRAASSFYLPLDRVVRVLERLRGGETIPRGGLLAVFEHEPYDELRRLGLRPETERAARRRAPEATGMLVVREVLPGGPAEGRLEPGDIVVRVAGERVRGFVPLEAALDARAGETVEIEVERGGEPLSVSVPVADLHDVTPDEYLEVGGGVLNELSYQQARNFALPLGGVFVAAPGYMLERAGIPHGAVLTEVGGRATPDLDAFAAALGALPDGTRVPVRWFRVDVPRNPRVSLVRVDRRWHPMQRCIRSRTTGHWPCTATPAPPAPSPPEPTTVRLPRYGEEPTRRLAASMAQVRFHIPYRVSGVYGERFVGSGLVVDAEQGLVVTDRDTVPVALGDATLTFAGSLEVPAEVVYLHPEHNLAVLRYDPRLLGDTPLQGAELRGTALEPGDDVWLVGMTRSHRLVSDRQTVSRVEPVSLPLPSPPRFRESNVALAQLTGAPDTVGGVLADDEGRVLALWASFPRGGGQRPEAFFGGLPAALVQDVVAPLARGAPVAWRSLGAELAPLSLAEARGRGLSPSAAARLEEHDPGHGQVLSVARLAADLPASRLLEEGDLLLGVGGEPVTRIRDVETAVQGREAVELEVLRDGAERALRVPTRVLPGRGIERTVLWAGALLQVPHRAVAAQRGIPREGVYVAWFAWGSPAHRYELGATRRITHVDGQPTPDLDALLAAVATKRDRDAVRVRTLDLQGRVEVTTLKLDLAYWPTAELRRTPEGWTRLEHRHRPERRVPTD